MGGVETRVRTPMSLPGLTAQRTWGRRVPERRLWVVGGLGNPAVRYCVHNNSLNNLARGIAERVMFERTEGRYHAVASPPERLVQARLGEFRRLLLPKIPTTPVVPLEEVPSMYYGRKALRAQQAVESLRVRPLEQRDSRLKTFLKAEKIAFTREKPDPKPRVIQPRDPRYVVSTARYLKKAEKAVYKGIAKVWGMTTVAKGLNADECGALLARKWARFKRAVAIGLDASAFDQHVSVPMLKYEHSVYNAMFRSPELRELLRWQLDNRGTGYAIDGKVKYRVEGRRMSGDINTALGNCLLMCAMVFAYARQVGVRVELANNGDDCVVFMEASDQQRFTQGLETWFTEMGFIMKVEKPVYELERVEFCQCQPVRVGDTWRMVRQPHRSTTKDSVCILDISTPGGFSKWCRAIGDCGASLTDGVPVLREYYAALQRVGGETSNIDLHPIMETGMSFMAKRMVDTGRTISEESRYSFFLAFGVTPDDQRLIESYYQSLHLAHSSPVPLDHPHLITASSSPQEVLHSLKSR